MNLQEVFKRLDLNKHAYSIYNELSKARSPLLVAQIAEKCKTSRVEVYRNLPKLLNKKFIKSEKLGKREYYSVTDPQIILEDFSKVRTDVDSTFGKVISNTKGLPPVNIRYFHGSLGIRAVFDDVISHTPKEGTFYRYTSEKDLEKVNKYLSPKYRENRDNKKLERMVISNPVSGKQKKSRLERFIKFIPTETSMFEQNIIQLVYGSRVAFIDLNNEKAFVVEDKNMADFQKVIFRQLYSKL